MRDVNELELMDRCVKEALRLFPPVPVVERDLANDVPIGGRVVPRGSMVLVAPLIMHHNEQVNEWMNDQFHSDQSAWSTIDLYVCSFWSMVYKVLSVSDQNDLISGDESLLVFQLHQSLVKLLVIDGFDKLMVGLVLRSNDFDQHLMA